MTDDTKIDGKPWSALKAAAMQPNIQHQNWAEQLPKEEKDKLARLVVAQKAQEIAEGNYMFIPRYNSDGSTFIDSQSNMFLDGNSMFINKDGTARQDRTLELL